MEVSPGSHTWSDGVPSGSGVMLGSIDPSGAGFDIAAEIFSPSAVGTYSCSLQRGGTGLGTGLVVGLVVSSTLNANLQKTSTHSTNTAKFP